MALNQQYELYDLLYNRFGGKKDYYKLNERQKEEYEKHHKKSISKLHRLLICKNCGLENKKTVFMNRDMNACINILNLSKEYINFKTRNENFCRLISI